jgi:hypothetical protein
MTVFAMKALLTPLRMTKRECRREPVPLPGLVGNHDMCRIRSLLLQLISTVAIFA